MRNIDWTKWITAGAAVAFTALAVPEFQQVLPAKAMPYVNGAITFWAILHRYQPTGPAPKPQEPPKS